MATLKQKWRNAVRRVRECMALLSEKTNPLDGKDMKWFFRISKFTTAMSSLCFLFSIYLLATDGGKYAWIRHIAAATLNGWVVRFNFRDMMKLKKKARMKKVLDIVDVHLDEYETMTLKLAVTQPDLPPPDRAEYEKARTDVIHDEQVMSMLAAVASGKFTFRPSPPSPSPPPPPTP